MIIKKSFAVFFVAIAIGCSKKVDKPTPITFNKFEVGTTADSIIYALGFNPDRRTSSSMEFRDVTFEGVRGDAVTYNIPGGRLTGGTFIKLTANPGNYDTLYNRYTSRYGKPISTANGLTIWENKEAELSLSKDQGIAVIMRRKTPNR